MSLIRCSDFHARRLIIQLDNAGGENKNHWLFGIVSLFILLGWFDTVELHMLIRGHTHDIQDAVFGNFHTVVFNEGQFVRLNCRPLVSLS